MTGCAARHPDQSNLARRADALSAVALKPAMVTPVTAGVFLIVLEDPTVTKFIKVKLQSILVTY